MLTIKGLRKKKNGKHGDQTEPAVVFKQEQEKKGAFVAPESEKVKHIKSFENTYSSVGLLWWRQTEERCAAFGAAHWSTWQHSDRI